MKVFIVHAHEEPRSFNAAMKNTAIKTFEEAGHSVVVSDLYRMGFKAVADGEDFLERRDRHYLKRQAEEQAAASLGTLAHDILEEQEKLKACDLLILQFPLWWFSMPAILKGWVDRVMTMGFAYGGGKWYDKGGLQGRRAMLAITTGGPEPSYLERGINGAMNEVLFPIQHGILYFCGFEVLQPFVAWSPAHLELPARTEVLDRYAEALAGIEGRERVPFHPLAHYDEGMQLKPDFSPHL
ncbi:MAG: NAD(P)H-dependent oxidoreductase [Holophaga sp.]|nr:NAD(P)H-dependent oxidoreductase [Holophaga sp.]